MADAASRHIGCCRTCDREVTRWQQTRLLLSTAVTDFATAVDVSSLRGDVLAALGFDSDAAVARRTSELVREAATREAAHPSAMREAAMDRGSESRSRRAGRKARREAAPARRTGIAAAWRFASAATVSAITAAAAVVLLSPSPHPSGTMVASPVFSASNHSTYQPATFRPGSRGLFAETSPAAYTPPPLARPKPSHVDGLEAAPGQLVSTWVQPRTNARVIWVQDRGLGAPVRMAGLDR